MDGDAAASAVRRQLSLQQRAVEQFRALAKPYRFYSNMPRLFGTLWAIPGVKRHQPGDPEIRAVFPPEAVEQVARVIQAQRRCSLSPEEARRRGFSPAHRATSGP